MKENHPELFERAKRYEMRKRERYDLDVASTSLVGSGNYTWSSEGTLDELVTKAEKHRKELGVIASTADKNKRWQDLLLEQDEDDPEDQARLICSL